MPAARSRSQRRSAVASPQRRLAKVARSTRARGPPIVAMTTGAWLPDNAGRGNCRNLTAAPAAVVLGVVPGLRRGVAVTSMGRWLAHDPELAGQRAGRGSGRLLVAGAPDRSPGR